MRSSPRCRTTCALRCAPTPTHWRAHWRIPTGETLSAKRWDPLPPYRHRSPSPRSTHSTHACRRRHRQTDGMQARVWRRRCGRMADVFRRSWTRSPTHSGRRSCCPNVPSVSRRASFARRPSPIRRPSPAVRPSPVARRPSSIGRPSSHIRHPSPVARRPSPVARRPSVLHCPSSVARRPPSIRPPLPVLRRPPSPAVTRRPSVVARPSVVVRRPPSPAVRRSSPVRRPPSIHRHPSVVHRPSVGRRPSPVARRPSVVAILPSIARPSPVVRRPPSAVRPPPSVTRRRLLSDAWHKRRTCRQHVVVAEYGALDIVRQTVPDGPHILLRRCARGLAAFRGARRGKNRRAIPGDDGLCVMFWHWRERSPFPPIPLLHCGRRAVGIAVGIVAPVFRCGPRGVLPMGAATITVQQINAPSACAPGVIGRRPDAHATAYRQESASRHVPVAHRTALPSTFAGIARERTTIGSANAKE
jgi:hypothetical protein